LTYLPAPVSPDAAPVPATASRLEPDAIGSCAAAFLAWIAARSLHAAPASQRLPVASIIAAVLTAVARFGLRAAEGRMRRPAGVLDD
jgi:hypothetical protein